MKLLIIDPYDQGGTGSLDFAIRAQDLGHKVKFFLKRSDRNRHVGKGLTDCIDDYKPWVRWADLIFNADNTLYLDDLARARNGGQCVISATKETAEWELNRDKGMSVLKRYTSVPSYQLFKDYNKAINHVKKTKARYVSKPNGDADKALSYCSKSPADMVYMLERWKRMDKLKDAFILQEFKAGTEMAVGGWFGPNGFNTGWCENFEFKKLMHGDLGVATGEMGTVLRYVGNSKLADKVLVPVAPMLERAGYCGYVDVNCIIDDEGTPWPLEFTMRPGWPTFNIQLAACKGDPVEWLYGLAMGEDTKQQILNQIFIGVVLAIPDFPYSNITRKEVTGIPIYKLSPKLWESIHPCEMMLSQAPQEVAGEIVNCPLPCTAGDYVMIVTSNGATIVESREKVYRKLDRIEIPNSPMYRTDIGRRLAAQLPQIQKNGYAKGMQYK
jgi:phosphoribosylamine---glycine ligase